MGNGPPKKRFGKKPGFNPKRLSDTNKPIATIASLDHLADEIKHAKDVRVARWLREKYILLKLGIEEPKFVAGDPGIEDIFGEAIENERDVDAALDGHGVIASVFNTPEGYVDGRREWLEMSGENWIAAMKGERKKRGTFRHENHSKTTNREDLALDCIYLRLPPWVAVVMRKKMVDDREILVTAMSALGTAFQKRFGVDTLGVVVHSESAHDLHAHIVFSQSKEVPRHGYKHNIKERRRLRRELNESVRTELKRAGKPSSNCAVHHEVAARIATGKVEDPDESAEGFDYIRRREETTIRKEWLTGQSEIVPIQVRGPAYRSKYWVWKESPEEKKEDVILRGESVDWKGGFRWMLREIPAGQTPADRWADIWCEATWQELVMDHATPADDKKVRAYGAEMTDQYIRSGSTIPGRVRLVADELERTRDALEEAQRAEQKWERLRSLNRISEKEKRYRELKERLEKREQELVTIWSKVDKEPEDENLLDVVSRLRIQRDEQVGIVAELTEKISQIVATLAKLLPDALKRELAKLLPGIISEVELGGKPKGEPPSQTPPTTPGPNTHSDPASPK